MFIRIQRHSPVPLARQIADQVRSQCRAGLLRPGESLPPPQELARRLVVNFQAVRRAYEELAAAELIELDAGRGEVLVAPTQNSPAANRRPHREMVLA